MSFGPELIWGWSRFLSEYAGSKVRKVEAADNWAALTLSRGVILLLCWDTLACGAAIAGENDKKALLSCAGQTPSVVGALKKHLAGAQLTEVQQLRRDRLLCFTFKRAVGAGFSSIRYLILEATERYGNLILLDEQQTIIEAAKHVHASENRFRTVLPGFPYVPPPPFNGVTLEEWLAAPSIGSITKISGFGRSLLLSLASLDVDRAADLLGRFYRQGSSGEFFAQQIGRYITYFPLLLEEAAPISGGLAAAGYAATLLPLLTKDTGARRKNIENRIQHEIKRREKQRCDIEALLALDPEEPRKKAELLVMHLRQVKKGASACELSGWDADGNEQTMVVQLDPAISPQKNAARLFARYKKLSASQIRAKGVLENVISELEELREQLAMAALTEDRWTLQQIEKELGLAGGKSGKAKVAKRKDEAPLPPHRRFDLGSALVFAGLSAGGNRYVTFSLASPEDLWFHTHGAPGSHVILRFSGTPSEAERSLAIKFCASLAAWFSKARENAKVRVDCAQKKHVSAIKGGTAEVTYREFKSISADPAFWKEYLSEKN